MTRSLAPCGTTSAYNRHLRNSETPCAECRAANAASQRDKLDQSPHLRERQWIHTTASNRARTALIRTYREEYRAMRASGASSYEALRALRVAHQDEYAALREQSKRDLHQGARP